MIPDDVEKIIMTKEDYDRNVEQLLYDKVNAELEVKRLNKILQDIKEYCNNRLDYYNEMRRDYMKEFDGYAENDAENILYIVNKVIGSRIKKGTIEHETTIINHTNM